MKKILILVPFCLSIYLQAQTTYEFIGNGNWSDQTQWLNEEYPGTNIDEDDTISITGNLTIEDGLLISNFGTIESFNTATSTPTINIIGSIRNIKTIIFNNTIVNIEEEGSLSLLNIDSKITVTNNSSIINKGYLEIDGGVLEVSSSVSSIINDKNINILEGSLNILSGKLENNSVRITNRGNLNIVNGEFINKGLISNKETGIINIEKNLSNSTTTSKITNDGVINIDGFGASFINEGFIINSKKINVLNSSKMTMVSGSIFFHSFDVVTISEGSTLINNSDDFSINKGLLVNNGTIENNNVIDITNNLQNDSALKGEIINNGVFSNNFGATLNTDGSFSGINIEHSGDFVNYGEFSPGNLTDSTGLYKIDSFFSSYIQKSPGELKIDIGGTIAGDTYDQIIVNRNVNLEGDLKVTLVDGFAPKVGDKFTIIGPSNSITGVFGIADLPELENGKKWDEISYSNTNGIVLSVIEDDSDLSTSVFEKSDTEFFVFPNPTNGIIHVTNNKWGYGEEVSVYDIEGKKRLTSKVKDEKIDLSSLESGVYFLHMGQKVTLIVRN